VCPLTRPAGSVLRHCEREHRVHAALTLADPMPGARPSPPRTGSAEAVSIPPTVPAPPTRSCAAPALVQSPRRRRTATRGAPRWHNAAPALSPQRASGCSGR
jgi:hypothetical protein